MDVHYFAGHQNMDFRVDTPTDMKTLRLDEVDFPLRSAKTGVKKRIPTVEWKGMERGLHHFCEFPKF